MEESVVCLVFVVGATLCALPCERVAKVTPIDALDADGWARLSELGLSHDGSMEAPSRLLWLTDGSGAPPLPISGACKVVTVMRRDILPLPALHRRVTPFSALVDATGRAALLLEPARLTPGALSPLHHV